MKILGIETSTLNASVAVRDGDRVVAKGDSAANTHREQLLVLVDAALAEAAIALTDVDGIAVGAGPGSFTGLRIGMATAKGLAYATGKPLWAVSSLAALASELAHEQDVGDRIIVPVLDARRKEIFIGFYRVSAEGVSAVADERVIAPSLFHRTVSEILGTQGPRPIALGNGLDIYAAALDCGPPGGIERANNAPTLPSATAVTRLASTGNLPNMLTHGGPVYVRQSEAEIKFPHGNPGGTFSR